MSEIDRAALIEAAIAAADADGYLVTLGRFDRSDAERCIDAVLPLIAEAIEAKRAESASWFRSMPGVVNVDRLNGADDAYRHAARMVRSLLGDTDGDR